MKRNVAFPLVLWGLTFWGAQAAKIPEEAKRHLARGAAALEMAKDNGDYQKAADEFEAAAKLAPKWTAPYFDLGVIYTKGNYILKFMLCCHCEEWPLNRRPVMTKQPGF